MLLLKNATIYPQTEEAPFLGDVLCKDGKTVQIGRELSASGAKVISQSLEPDTETDAGTVVTVQMGTMSNIAD